MIYCSENFFFIKRMSFEFPKFLLFGDSITEYAYNQYPLTSKDYAAASKTAQFNPDDPEKAQYQTSGELCFSMSAKLNDDYRRKMQIVHRGYAGYNSDQGVKIANALLAREHDGVSPGEQFKLAMVFFGSNDYRRTTPETGYMEGVPLDRFESNMTKIVDSFLSRGIKLILVTPGLHDDVLWDECSPGELSSGTYRTNEVGAIYGDCVKSIAAAKAVPVVDMYSIMMEYVKTHLGGDLKAIEHGKLGDLLIDGIHFSGLSYKLFYDALKLQIKVHYPQWCSENLPDKFPHWASTA